MRKIIFHMMISVDGFFEGPNHDISWHNIDQESNEYAIEWLNELDTFLFGRVIYELMAGYWPTSTAVIKGDDIVADGMNNMKKIVFSKTLQKVDWKNSTLVREVVPEEILKLKQQPGKDISIGGSDLALTFIKHNLIDEFRIIVAPIAIGKGRSLFEGMDKRLNLELIKTKKFKSGNILLYYKPVNAKFD